MVDLENVFIGGKGVALLLGKVNNKISTNTLEGARLYNRGGVLPSYSHVDPDHSSAACLRVQ